MHYAIGLQTAFFVTFVAFIPATVVAAKTGIWYMNVLYTEGYHNPFQTLVGAHAISGLLMLVLFSAQSMTGAFPGAKGRTPEEDARARKYHRFVGRWILSPLIILACVLAMTAEAYANLCCQDPDPATFLLAITITICFTNGIRAVMRKDYTTHKDNMFWVCMMACGVGMSRAAMYIIAPLYDCDTLPSLWPFFLSTVLGLSLAAYSFHSVGRFNWKHKHNVIWFTLEGLVGVYFFVHAWGWECPAEGHSWGGSIAPKGSI